ncbi:MAG: winged helix-turn-helix domain-containing protein [Euryarchaeota archaeon]|nr:winged helix-turn-helix domain-containing protein [Euryarchaeota archaeon]
MKRRNKFDIIIAILDVVSSGANKTKIAYKVDLKLDLATAYMELLLERGMVRTNGSTYEMTAKGEIFAKKAKELPI